MPQSGINFARAYLRLAEQADRNSFADSWMEYGVPIGNLNRLARDSESDESYG